MKITVEPRCDGMIIRDFARREVGLSRGILTRLKSFDGGIKLNGLPVHVGVVLHGGDILELELSDRAEDMNEYTLPVQLDIDILYEDEGVILAGKPAAMPTHTSHNHRDDTLENALAWYFAERDMPFVFRAVNRLDADTSGVVMVAKNRRAAYYYGAQLQNGGFVKRYLAVCDGLVEEDSGVIEKYIRRAGESIILRECCREEDEGAEYALTEYRVLARDRADQRTLLELSPKTGRTHQLRVHMASLGHPLTGDYLYGTEGNGGMKRHALHAYSLEFTAESGERMKVTCPMPDDLKILTADFDYTLPEN